MTKMQKTALGVWVVNCGYCQGWGRDSHLWDKASFSRRLLGIEGKRRFQSLAEAHAFARRCAEPRSKYWITLEDGYVSDGWQDKPGAATIADFGWKEATRG